MEGQLHYALRVNRQVRIKMTDMQHIIWTDDQLDAARKRDEERKKEEVKVSNCCGEEDRLADINGPDWGDLGLCPRCKEHCEFIENDAEIDGGSGNVGA